MLPRFITLRSLAVSALCFDCTGVTDGVYEAGCKSFVVCSNGVATLTECERNQVYNDATGACAE